MKTTSTACVLAALLLITSALTGCATASSALKASPQLYQPRVLRLLPGQPVQTADGIYTPQAAETWHSAPAYNALESQALNATAALAQERARSTR